MTEIINKLRNELQLHSDEETKAVSKRFFKETVNVYGIKTALVSKIGKEIFKEIAHLSKDEILDICEKLWQSDMLEETFIACEWTYSKRKEFAASDIFRFKTWIEKYITNWASCDTFCNHSVGYLMEKFPENMSILKEMTHSQNRWMRRASAVSLIIPARKGLFKEDIFEIANILLLDSDDMVQKGYGWMLKVCSQEHQQEVFEFVMRHKKVMPRTALRYAIEKMPKELKIRAMAK